MDPVALVLGFLAGLAVVVLSLGIRQLLRRQLRQASAHTESGPAQGLKPAAPPPAPQEGDARPTSTPAAARPIQALMTYTKTDGSTSVRTLTIYSRNLKDGQTHSLNCRQQGERITKQFLLSGISRIELPDRFPPLVLSDSQAIGAWLERHIPERSPTARSAGPTVSSAPVSAAPVAPPTVTRPDALPAFPHLPAPPPRPPVLAETSPAPPPLPELLPDGARGFAVLDLETTGVGRSCRIVEIALVRLDPQGRITEEWETLVHPGIPIPNAHIHGIDDAMVAGAPSFADIAGTLAAKLHAHVLVAHNLRSFDGPILEAHFAEVDGVELDAGVAHTALGDTRALTRALQNGMAHLEPAGSAVAVQRNGLVAQSARTLTRAMAAAASPPSGWKAVALQLETGQVFVTTGPASMKADTAIKRAEAHGVGLGLQYRKVSTLPKRQPPAFLLSTSLTLANRKMSDAQEMQIPVVLCQDFMQARCGITVRAWRYQS